MPAQYTDDSQEDSALRCKRFEGPCGVTNTLPSPISSNLSFIPNSQPKEVQGWSVPPVTLPERRDIPPCESMRALRRSHVPINLDVPLERKGHRIQIPRGSPPFCKPVIINHERLQVLARSRAAATWTYRVKNGRYDAASKETLPSVKLPERPLAEDPPCVSPPSRQ